MILDLLDKYGHIIDVSVGEEGSDGISLTSLALLALTIIVISALYAARRRSLTQPDANGSPQRPTRKVH